MQCCLSACPSLKARGSRLCITLLLEECFLCSGRLVSRMSDRSPPPSELELLHKVKIFTCLVLVYKVFQDLQTFSVLIKNCLFSAGEKISNCVTLLRQEPINRLLVTFNW